DDFLDHVGDILVDAGHRDLFHGLRHIRKNSLILKDVGELRGRKVGPLDLLEACRSRPPNLPPLPRPPHTSSQSYARRWDSSWTSTPCRRCGPGRGWSPSARSYAPRSSPRAWT